MGTRGPYKQYFVDDLINVPRRTLYDARQREASLNLGDYVGVHQSFTLEGRAEGNEMMEVDPEEEPLPNFNIYEENLEQEMEFNVNMFEQNTEQDAEENVFEFEADRGSDIDSDDSSDTSDCTDREQDCNENIEFPPSSFETRFSKHNARPLFLGSEISESESLLLIFSFAVRHKISNSCLEDLLKLLKFHLPGSAKFPTSLYRFEKELGFDYSGATKNYYCKSCFAHVGSQPDGTCQACDKQLDIRDLDKSGSFFYNFNIKKSLSTLLKIKEVQMGLQKTFELRKTNRNYYGDIHDGKMYKKLKLQNFDLSMTTNSDGVPIFKSSHYSIWPILISINELPHNLRRKHIMFAGLWFGTSKPEFDAFFPPFVEQCNEIKETGLNWTLDNNQVHSKIYFPICVMDSPARCQIQGLKQYNGPYSCPWCLIPGETMHNPENPRSHKLVFPPITKRQVENRTKENFLRHLRELDEKIEKGEMVEDVFGVNHASELLLLNEFDIVSGFVFDYMHAGLLGIGRWYAWAWLDPCNHTKDYYIGRKIPEIDKRLLQVLVPYDTQRAVRSLCHRRFWKASEWRTWIMTVPIILKDILPDVYINHFTLFVSALSALCAEQITTESIDLAEKRLFKFVKLTEELYGLESCSSNLHLFIHAPQCVKNWGPLSEYSTFLYENYNGIFLNFFNGTQYVPAQIACRVQEISVARTLEKDAFSNFAAFNFFYSLVENKKSVKKSEEMNNCRFLGAGGVYMLSPSEKTGLQNKEVFAEGVTRYDKVILHGKVYSSFSKSTTRRCNSIVMIKDKLHLIRFFLSISTGNNNKVGMAAVSKIEARKQRNFKRSFSISRVNQNHAFVFMEEIVRSKFIGVKEGGNLVWAVQLPNIVELE